MQINRRLGNKTFAHSSLLAGVEKIYISMNVERVSSSSQHFLFFCAIAHARTAFFISSLKALRFPINHCLANGSNIKSLFPMPNTQVPLPASCVQ